MGLQVSCDLNYRKNLWKYGKTADQVMTELVKYVDTIIANEEDFQKALLLKADSQSAVETGELNVEQYKAIAALAMRNWNSFHVRAKEPCGSGSRINRSTNASPSVLRTRGTHVSVKSSVKPCPHCVG